MRLDHLLSKEYQPDRCGDRCHPAGRGFLTTMEFSRRRPPHFGAANFFGNRDAESWRCLTADHSAKCILAAMPTVLRIGPYRFFFYSADRKEPPHIHVEREARWAKFWLNPVRLHDSRGFHRAEIRRLQVLVRRNESGLLEAWHGFFGD